MVEHRIENGEVVMIELSSAGRMRREEMRARVLGAGRRRRRRRQLVRAGGVVAVLAALVVSWSPWRDDAPNEAPSAPVATDRPVLRHMDFAAVTTDSNAPARWTVRSVAPPAEWFIDDAELMRLAATVDRPVGIVRSGDRLLLTRDLVDHLQ